MFETRINIKIATDTTRSCELQIKVFLLSQANCDAEIYLEIQYLRVNVKLFLFAALRSFTESRQNFCKFGKTQPKSFKQSWLNRVDGSSIGIPLQSAASFAKNSISYSRSEPPRRKPGPRPARLGSRGRAAAPRRSWPRRRSRGRGVVYQSSAGSPQACAALTKPAKDSDPLSWLAIIMFFYVLFYKYKKKKHRLRYG